MDKPADGLRCSECGATLGGRFWRVCTVCHGLFCRRHTIVVDNLATCLACRRRIHGLLLGREPMGAIVGQRKNTAVPPSSSIDWLLRIDEGEPAVFIGLVERHFAPGSGIRRRMVGGRTRAQFKSSALMQEFIDQTEGTD